ncbi:MAG: peptidoglycan synthetase, partial [Bacteroidales bacterium]|nr:peptidoglycan synthetase [Bacteroidales bacterium]
WDHINVFPTFENYIDQFRIFADLITKNGTLIYCADDPEVKKIGENCRSDIRAEAYDLPEHSIENGITYLHHNENKYALEVFGEHNLLNLMGAKLVCNSLGINDEDFFISIQSFSGASKRLESVASNESTTVFKDFAHSPSKLKATTNAVKSQYTYRKLVACLELHTYSSLSAKFLELYKGCMDAADVAFVYFSHHAIELKRLPEITTDQVKNAFARTDLQVYTHSDELKQKLLSIDWENKNLLMMSSGNFDGIDINALGQEICS